jgi:hypothetical protein
MFTHGMLVVGALVLLAAEAQPATTLTTPFVAANTGQGSSCIVTNVDSGKPVTVTVELVDGDGFTVTPIGGGCPVPPAALAPRDTCVVVVPANTGVYCQVVSSGKKVRVALSVFDTTLFQHVLQAVGTK